MTRRKAVLIGNSLTEWAITHGASPSAQCSSFLVATSRLPSDASVIATRPTFTGLIVSAFGKILLWYQLIKAVSKWMFAAKSGKTKNPTFSQSNPVYRCTFLNSLTSIGLWGADRRRLAFTVRDNGVRAVKINSFLVKFGPAFVSKMTIYVVHPSCTECSSYLVVSGL